MKTLQNHMKISQFFSRNCRRRRKCDNLIMFSYLKPKWKFLVSPKKGSSTGTIRLCSAVSHAHRPITTALLTVQVTLTDQLAIGRAAVRLWLSGFCTVPAFSAESPDWLGLRKTCRCCFWNTFVIKRWISFDAPDSEKARKQLIRSRVQRSSSRKTIRRKWEFSG